MGRYRATFTDQEMLNFMKHYGLCTVNKLIARFDVTRQAIHYRLNKLMKMGLVGRNDGKGNLPGEYYVTNFRKWGRKIADK